MTGLLIFLRRSLDLVEWVLSHLAQALWALAVLWVVFACARLTEYSTRRFPTQIAPTVRFLTQAQPWTHVVGASILVLAVLAVYVPRRKTIALAWPLLRTGLPQPIETLTTHVIGEAEVQRELREFSKDALELRIIAEDSGFLEAGRPQHQEALRFGPNCKILLSSRHRVSDLALKTLTDRRVQIRVYASDAELLEVNLLGELKRSATGAAACLFDRASTGYRIINLSNETLVRLVMAEFDTWFERGRNALIRHVIFDLAGVAFDGNILRGRGTFGRCVASLKAAVELGYYTSITTCVHPGNVDHLEAMIEFAASLGAAELNFHPLFKMGIARDGFSGETDISPQRWVAAYRTLRQGIEAGRYPIHVRAPQRFVATEEYRRHPERYAYCPTRMAERILVHPDGTLRICALCIGTPLKIASYDHEQVRFCGWRSELSAERQKRRPCMSQLRDVQGLTPLCISYKPFQHEYVWRHQGIDQRLFGQPGRDLEGEAVSLGSVGQLVS